jgi:hypothetical protein
MKLKENETTVSFKIDKELYAFFKETCRNNSLKVTDVLSNFLKKEVLKMLENKKKK